MRRALGRVFGSQLGQNIVSNYLAVVWMGGLSLALIPLYLKKLGAEQWGVVAICMAIQGFLGLLDAGLGQIMPRDIARVDREPAALVQLYAMFARGYAALGLLGLLAGQAAVPWLIGAWFNQGQGLAGAELALRLVLLQFFFQFANNANSGYWNGIQAQKRANLRQCVFASLKHGSALSLVFAWKAEPVAYLMPFVAVACLECLLNRRAILRELPPAPRLAWADFQRLAREAGMLAAAVLIGMLVSQLDRIVLSRAVAVVDYGRYVIVANLGLAFLQLQYPLMRALFPRIVQAEAGRGRSASMRATYVGVGVLCIAPCVVVALAAPWVLHLWLHDAALVAAGSLPLRLILGGVALNTLYSVAYQKLVAQGRTRRVVCINLACLAIVAPLTWFAAVPLGIAAGGLAWLAIGVLQLGLASLATAGVARRDKNISC